MTTLTTSMINQIYIMRNFMILSSQLNLLCKSNNMQIKLLLFLSLFVAVAVAQHDGNFVAGRTTIVHLFEWTWNSIALECERFLGPYGYGGVQVSPVSENAIVTNPNRPWYERYQPVSYHNMVTRSGNGEQFQDMVRRCNAVGVRIYVDLIMNHMTWSSGSGKGTGGSTFNAVTKAFPEYSAPDFNARSKCPSSSGEIENYNDPQQVRNCQLASLVDLDQSKEYVRSHIAKFLNKLIGWGVAGFRVDAAKHMWPEDSANIYSRMDNLSTAHGFKAGARPFIYQEVIDMSDSGTIHASDYFSLGRVTEFRYGRELGPVFRGDNALRWLYNWGTAWGLFQGNRAVVFIDNHDNQRGHGAGGSVLTHKESRLYKMATAFMLAHQYGLPRVMSSYSFTQDWTGPPNNNGVTLPPTINPDLSCGNGWICEHRWRSIYAMVKFRNVVNGTTVTNWWDNQSNQISFCRGNKGFIAINGDNTPLSASLQTCLPAGQYCDVITGGKQGSSCVGTKVTVGSDGKATINLTNLTEDPILAIHAESKL